MKLVTRSLLLILVSLFSLQVFAQSGSLRVVVLGSSTASGCCAPGGQGWVDLCRSYLAATGRTTEVINLGIGGNTTFDILPTGYVSPYRSLNANWNKAPNSSCNITKALSYSPTHIIINLPTNDAELGIPVAYQLVHYAEVLARASAQNVPVWITTTQPRNLGVSGRQLLMDMRDATFSRFGSCAIDFWNGLANADGTIMTAYNYDGTHLNAAGHQVLYERVRGIIPLDPVALANILSNGGFESGTSSWNFYTNGSGTFATTAGGTQGTTQAKIAIVTEGTNVQLNQTGVTLATDTEYQLSFDAYSSSGHDLTVSLAKNVSPYTNYGLMGAEFNLGTSWQHFSITFTTWGLGSTVTDGRLMFWLAPYDAAGDVYYIDNIVLAKTSGSASTALTITTQPQSQTVTAGQTATFSVAATGTAPLTYQWQKNNSNISGATGLSYTTAAVSSGDNGSTYRVIVSNSSGSVTSYAATLTVSGAPTAGSSTGGMLANSGFESGTSPWNFYSNGSGVLSTVSGGTEGAKTAKISIVVEGTNVQLNQTGVTLASDIKYQLSFDAYSSSGHDLTVSLAKNVSPYTSYGLMGAEFNLGTSWQHFSTTFTTWGLGGTVTDGRLMFWLAPYDAAGDEYYIDNVVLTKADAVGTAPTITLHPQSQTVTAGQTGTFSVVATGTAPFTYQWQKNSVNISGATGTSYTTAAVSSGDNGSTYRAIVSNSSGSAASSAATLTVSSTTAAVSSTVNVLTNGGFESGTSSWNFYSNGSGVLSTVSGGTEGATSTKIAIATEGTNVQLNQTGVTLASDTKYQLSFDAYCSSGHDLTISLLKTVAPYTNYGMSSVEFNLGTSWGHYSATFTTGSLGGTVTDGRLMFWLAPYDAAGDMYYFDNIVLAKTEGSTIAAPAITAHPQNQTVTAGQTGTFSVVATGTVPLTYQWQKNSANITGATGSSYTTASVSSGDNGSTYRVIVSNSLGSATSNSATLTVSGSSSTTTSTATVLANGGFESGTSSWNFYSNGSGVLSTVSGGTEGAAAVRIAIVTEGTNVQLNQTGVSLASDTKYQLSFDAYCSSGHDLTVSLLKNVSPYTSYGLMGAEFNLGTSWQHFATTFTTWGLGGKVTDGRLMFWLAPYDAAGDVYYFDNILLTMAPSAEVADSKADAQSANESAALETRETVPTRLQLQQNFPNPFNPSTTIMFDLPVQSYVRVRIYDVLGRDVETLLEGERTAGTYRLHWDARNVSSGVYFCRLQVEAAGSGETVTTLSRKLILSK
jgi:lysophospholipase L1-like esterase